MCAEFQVSMIYSLRENPFGGFRVCDDSLFCKFSSKFQDFKFMFLDQHVANQLSFSADEWRQHCRSCVSPVTLS